MNPTFKFGLGLFVYFAILLSDVRLSRRYYVSEVAPRKGNHDGEHVPFLRGVQVARQGYMAVHVEENELQGEDSHAGTECGGSEGHAQSPAACAVLAAQAARAEADRLPATLHAGADPTRQQAGSALCNPTIPMTDPSFTLFQLDDLHRSCWRPIDYTC